MIDKKKLFVGIIILLILITIITLVLLNNNNSEEPVVKGFIVKNQNHVFSVDMTPEEYEALINQSESCPQGAPC